MRILQITPFFYPGLTGVELHTLTLSLGLSERGHQVDVLTLNIGDAPKEELIADKVKVYRCSPIFKYRELSLSFELIKKLLQAKNYDLYHIHIPFPFVLGMAIVASKINNIPLIVTHHGEGAKGKSDLLYSLMATLYIIYLWSARTISLRFASRIIFQNQSYPESLGLSIKIKERIRIVRTGVDSQLFSPLNEGSKLRAKYGFNDSDRVMLFVGSLAKSHRFKGIDYLIKAIFVARNNNGNIKLVIVGGGDLISELKQLARKLELEHDVIFTGSILHEQLPPYYAMCDAFVLPSTSGPECYSLVVLEAMASGRPVIVSDLPGVRDNVNNERTGLKVPPRNPRALAEAILRLAKDDNLRIKMGQMARKETERYTWAKCAEDTEAVYREAT